MFKHANPVYCYLLIFLETRHFEEETKERILLMDLPYIWPADFFLESIFIITFC